MICDDRCAALSLDQPVRDPPLGLATRPFAQSLRVPPPSARAPGGGARSGGRISVPVRSHRGLNLPQSKASVIQGVTRIGRGFDSRRLHQKPLQFQLESAGLSAEIEDFEFAPSAEGRSRRLGLLDARNAPSLRDAPGPEGRSLGSRRARDAGPAPLPRSAARSRAPLARGAAGAEPRCGSRGCRRARPLVSKEVDFTSAHRQDSSPVVCRRHSFEVRASSV